jgi:hypothetical protein
MSAVFEVRAAGSSPLSYQWLQNEMVLPGATNRVLLLSNVTLAQNGGYRVVVSNAFGVVTSQVATMLVRAPRGVVGYFADYNAGLTNPAPAIVRAGFTPLLISDISAVNLASLDILYVEGAASTPSPALQGRLPAIQDWVASGKKFIAHDAVAEGFGLRSSPLLLGLTGVLVTNTPQHDLSVVPPGSSLVTAGPHGTLTESSLDNGAPSAVGYVVNSTLPDAALRILATANSTNQITALSYGLARARFSRRSTLWQWLNQTPFSELMRETYVPNVIEHVAAFVASGPPVLSVSSEHDCPRGQLRLILCRRQRPGPLAVSVAFQRTGDPRGDERNPAPAGRYPGSRRQLPGRRQQPRRNDHQPNCDAGHCPGQPLQNRVVVSDRVAGRGS